MFEDVVPRIASAFGIGLLMGLERGWSTREVQPGSRAAGVRTFGITGLLGGLVGALAGTPNVTLNIGGAILIATAFATFSAVIITFARAESAATGNHSATSAVAALLTFVLGVYAAIGNVGVAAAAAVAAAAILALREGIHGWVKKITQRELESGLGLLAMTFIALPIVPDRPIGPFGGVNLREVWTIAIALAAISFAGYIAVKQFGEHKGTLISAAAGGIVSSTAVALSNARRVSAGEGSPGVLAAGTALAMAISFLRVMAIVGALRPALLLSVGPSLFAAALVAIAAALLPFRRYGHRDTKQPGVVFRNPFGFWSVVFMAASMGVLIVIGRYISERFGASGAITSAAAMGLFDVDAMTVSMARLAPETAGQGAAGWAILAGVASNTLTKIIISGVVGRGRFAVQVAAISLGCIAAGIATMAVASRF